MVILRLVCVFLLSLPSAAEVWRWASAVGFETEADHLKGLQENLQVVQTCIKNKGEVKNKMTNWINDWIFLHQRKRDKMFEEKPGAGLRSYFKCCKENSEIPHWTFSGLKICLSWSYYEKWLHIEAVWLLLKMHTQSNCQKDFFCFSGPLLCKPQHMCNFPLWAAPTGLTMRSTFQGSEKVATNI